MDHISSSSSSHDSRILKENVVCFSMDSNTDFNSSSCTSTDECDDTIMSDELDREQHDLFIKEYFRQQYLIMQDLYPSHFKSKQETNQQLLKTEINKQLSYSTSTDAMKRSSTLVTNYGQQDQQQQKKKKNEKNPSPKDNFDTKEKRKLTSVQKLLKKFESLGQFFLLGKTN